MRRLLLSIGLALAGSLAHAQWVEESLPADPGPLDFIHGESYEQWIFQSLAGDALVGLSPEGRVVPRLAAAWREGPKGKVVFTLRGDARFGDGGAVRAEDVVWTFEQLLSDTTASPTKRGILAGASVGAEGERTQGRPPAQQIIQERDMMFWTS